MPRARAAASLRGPLLLAALLLPACGSGGAPLVLGRPGLGPGEFDTPRGLAAAGGRVAVLDRTGRLQRFTAGGVLERAHRVMPEEVRRGFPLGLVLDPDGSSLVVHTHDAALVRYDPSGRETLRWGSAGVGDGGFTMPQRACTAGGEVFVSDFGYEDAHRVLVFTPEGRFLRRIGGPGTGAVFRRPMGVAVDGEGVLWVADASHRLFRFEAASGRPLGTVGREGGGPGELRWPTGIASLPGGGVAVCEAGNHRLQRFDAAGRPRGTFGRNGGAPGEFREPYDLAADPPWLFVADTGNHRVQRLRIDAVPWQEGNP
jgi:DNA-binding beta-propeller fold protein YncE